MAKRPLFTGTFWLDLLDRVIRTAAQTALAIIAVDATTLGDIDWPRVGGVVGLAVVLTILTSIATAKVGAPGTAALVAGRDGHAMKARD
jgi:Putative lactococcus lactis phage r1t holin